MKNKILKIEVMVEIMKIKYKEVFILLGIVLFKWFICEYCKVCKV